MQQLQALAQIESQLAQRRAAQLNREEKGAGSRAEPGEGRRRKLQGDQLLTLAELQSLKWLRSGLGLGSESG